MENYNLSFRFEQGSFVYRVAAIIIKDNKLLVAKHKNSPFYYTVGGKVELNETSEEAVIRECFEETGIKFEVDRLIFVQERFFKLNEIKHHELVFFYLMKKPFNFNILENSFSDQGEMETLHWLDIEFLERYPIVPEFIKTKKINSVLGIEHIISKE